MSSEKEQLKHGAVATPVQKGASDGAGLSAATQASIGSMLRQYYAELVDAPLPAPLLKLRRELEEREITDDDRENEEPSGARQS